MFDSTPIVNIFGCLHDDKDPRVSDFARDLVMPEIHKAARKGEGVIINGDCWESMPCYHDLILEQLRETESLIIYGNHDFHWLYPFHGGNLHGVQVCDKDHFVLHDQVLIYHGYQADRIQKSLINFIGPMILSWIERVINPDVDEHYLHVKSVIDSMVSPASKRYRGEGLEYPRHAQIVSSVYHGVSVIATGHTHRLYSMQLPNGKWYYEGGCGVRRTYGNHKRGYLRWNRDTGKMRMISLEPDSSCSTPPDIKKVFL